MSQRRITRRHALKVAGGGIILSVLPGCGEGGSGGARQAISHDVTVIIKVAFKIHKVLSVVLAIADGVLTILAIIDGIQKTVTAKPTKKQVAELKNGGKLLIEGSDGQQFEVPFTVQ